MIVTKNWEIGFKIAEYRRLEPDKFRIAGKLSVLPTDRQTDKATYWAILKVWKTNEKNHFEEGAVGRLDMQMSAIPDNAIAKAPSLAALRWTASPSQYW